MKRRIWRFYVRDTGLAAVAVACAVVAGCTTTSRETGPTSPDAQSTDAQSADAQSTGSQSTDAQITFGQGPDASQDATVLSCTSVDDCAGLGLGTAWCCLNNVCAYSPGTPLIACNDADVQPIQASSYDQACTADSDCVAVAEGNFCYPGANNCPSAAINVGAKAQYDTDVAMTNAAICGGTTNCPNFTSPCCRGGSCSLGAACLSGADSGAESDAGRVPVNHRPSDAQCSTSAAVGDCSGSNGDGGCNSDSDCTEAGVNGRCINQGGGPAAPCFCTYDECLVDTDCAAGQTCACHGAPYTDGHGNTCVTGNCRVDADCGEGYCSPTSTGADCGDNLAGYYCHTAADLCTDDTDCDGECIYSTANSRWQCVGVIVCL
jgi:hypothetical protein